MNLLSAVIEPIGTSPYELRMASLVSRYVVNPKLVLYPLVSSSTKLWFLTGS